MKRNLLFAAALMLVAGSLFAAPPSNVVPIPVTGTFIDGAGTGTLAGTFHLSKFAVVDDVLVARGLLTGTLTNATGVSLGSFMKSVAIPVSSIDGASSGGLQVMSSHNVCDILFLQLGPLDLDLLGLVVHLDQVTLDIDAETGSGNLLGNLLCAVTGLLDGAGSLFEISNLLNRILGIISGLLG